MSKLTFPNFEDIKVSTRTFTSNTNLNIDLDKLFNLLPVTEYIEVPKRRGRKKKGEVIDPNKDIEHGSIITLMYKDSLRGVNLKKKTKNKGKFFRNSFTVVIIFDKHINFKVCKNGTFQMTGCKNIEHAMNCVKTIWEYIKDEKDVYTFSRGNNLEVLFVPVMRNIDFSLGFVVDREKLAQYIMQETDFFCIFELILSYTGVNIKIPMEKDIEKLRVTKLTYTKSGYKTELVTYKEYLNLLPEKDQKNKRKQSRWNTFLVFHSGNVIMTGIDEEFMRDAYYLFLETIKICYEHIEERLDIK